MKKLGSFMLAVFAAALVALGTSACRDSSSQAGYGARNPNIVVLTEKNFETEVTASARPVLVDFWASWCAPCRMLAPIIDEIATEYQGRVKVCSLDVDSAPALPERHQVQA